MLKGHIQDKPLLIAEFIKYASEHYGSREIVSRIIEDGSIHRYTYRDAHKRSRQLAKALLGLGIKPGDRVATMAWNTFRHFECFYGISGIEAVLHTVNPRLFEEQIIYIMNHAEDRFLFVDLTFIPLLETLWEKLETIERIIVMTDRDHMPETALPNLVCYEDLLAGYDDDFEWPLFDEWAASSLCYTSGTTGNPKGVLYAHRSTYLHALGAAQLGAFGISAFENVMPIAPMYHANAWAFPYIAPMCGAKFTLPGADMSSPALHQLIETEEVTFAAAVPTVWTQLFDYLEQSDLKVEPLKRTVIAGSAVPRSMMQTFKEKYGVQVLQLWGMTEMSPVGTCSNSTPEVEALPDEERASVLEKQGRLVFGVEAKIVGPDGELLPHDGIAFGDLWVRGPWIANGYFKDESGQMLDDEGWFPTGDVATMDPYGYIKITDRTKDVIKSGGEWISSIELESLAVAHPKVSEAAVVGVYHKKWEERPLLIVVLASGAEGLEEEIKKDILETCLVGKVAKWWLPDDVVFRDAMPMTATGKIKKLTLREEYKDYLAKSGE